MRNDNALKDIVVVPIKISSTHSNYISSSEKEIVQSAGSSRRREFASGRRAAKLALSKFGVVGHSILKSESGAPIWPMHLIGSISHAPKIAVAAVATKKTYHAIGIDVEEKQVLSKNMHRFFMSESELEKNSLSEDNYRAISIFSMKEAILKMILSKNDKRYELRDIHLSYDTNGNISASIENNVLANKEYILFQQPYNKHLLSLAAHIKI